MVPRIGEPRVLRALVACCILLEYAHTSLAQEIQVPESRRGIRTAPILLLCRPEIQKELALTPEVASEAKALASGLQRKATALHGKTGPGVQFERRTIDQEQTEWLNKTLTAQQLDRLLQLDLQWEGTGAFISRPMIAEYLSITPKQAETIKRLYKSRVKQQISQAESDQIQARILTQLSEQQRDQWNALLGKPFRFDAGSPTQDSQVLQSGGASTR